MPTNEERKEVAENLRSMTVYGCLYKEQFYDLLEETVMRTWDVHSFEDVADRLADLIEPEPERIYRLVWNDDCDTWECRRCGAAVGHPDVRYCEECGCKVKEETDAD